MPDVVEIYVCKAGQKLEEGRLVVSNDITSKEDARSDALSRCSSDPTVAKVAYYAISEDGDFKAYFSYTNPDVSTAQPAAPAASGKRKSSAAKRNPPRGIFGGSSSISTRNDA